MTGVLQPLFCRLLGGALTRGLPGAVETLARMAATGPAAA